MRQWWSLTRKGERRRCHKRHNGGKERGKGKQKEGEEVVVGGSREGERMCVKDGKGPTMA